MAAKGLKNEKDRWGRWRLRGNESSFSVPIIPAGAKWLKGSSGTTAETGTRVFSAGASPSRVNPMAIKVMGEKGVDITGQRSKSIDEFPGQDFDFIVTTCDNARDQCPVFPGQGEMLHWGLEDPAEARGSREEKLKVFRRVRDELEKLIQSHFLDGPC